MIAPRRVIILEGNNYFGKSEVMPFLKERFPGASVMEQHGYYRPHILRMMGASTPMSGSKINYSRISDDIRASLREYGLSRIRSKVEEIRRERLDDFLVERLHVTDYVYWKFIASSVGQEVDLSDYSMFEDVLNEENALLVLLTLDEEVMRERMLADENTRKREGSGLEISPFWCSLSFNLQKKRMYEEFYDQSRMKRKMLMDASHLTYEEIAKRILTA